MSGGIRLDHRDNMAERESPGPSPQCLLCTALSTSPSSLGSFPHGEWQGPGQAKLGLHRRGRSCCSCRFKPENRYYRSVRGADAGVSIFAEEVTCSRWKSYWINLSSPVGFPRVIWMFEGHPEKPRELQDADVPKRDVSLWWSSLLTSHIFPGRQFLQTACLAPGSWQGWKWWVQFFEAECY